MRAELSILRARSIFVNQGWEIVRLNSTKGWQNVNCRRTYSIARRDCGGEKNTVCGQPAVCTRLGDCGSSAACSLGGGHVTESPPLSEPLQTHTFMACQGEVTMLYWKYEFHAHDDRAGQTGQETQNSPSHHVYLK